MQSRYEIEKTKYFNVEIEYENNYRPNYMYFYNLDVNEVMNLFSIYMLNYKINKYTIREMPKNG